MEVNMNSKKNVLNRLNCELEQLNKNIKLIENLKIESVDEKTWHEICLTPARYKKDLIIEIAKKTFPNGENFEKCANYIYFTLNGFDIKIPICAERGIIIDLKWFKPMYGEPPKEYR